MTDVGWSEWSQAILTHCIEKAVVPLPSSQRKHGAECASSHGSPGSKGCDASYSCVVESVQTLCSKISWMRQEVREGEEMLN